MSLQCDNLSGELQDQWSSSYVLKKTLTPGVILTLAWGYIQAITILESNKFIYIYIRSQVSAYRTIGPLVSFVALHSFQQLTSRHDHSC